MATWTFAVNRSASRSSERRAVATASSHQLNRPTLVTARRFSSAAGPCVSTALSPGPRAGPLGRGHPRHLPPSRARAECLFVAGRTSVRVCLAASLALTRRGRRPARTARTPWRRSVAVCRGRRTRSQPRWPHALGAPCFPVRSARTLLVRRRTPIRGAERDHPGPGGLCASVPPRHAPLSCCRALGLDASVGADGLVRSGAFDLAL